MKPFDFVRAGSVAEAGAAFVPDAAYLAGGTNLVDHLRLGIREVDRLVDINRVGLTDITELPGGGLRVGALVKNSAMAAHPLIRERYPVLAEAILLLRGIPEKNAVAHRGGWLKSADNAYEIRGKTLGIVGYGSIGTQLSVLAEGLGMQVAFYDVVNKLPLGNARQVHNLHALLGQCDIVSLHVPELPSTQWMIGAAEIAAMKPGGILINAARGTVVEIEPLAQALRDKKLLGAAIDVFPVEPRTNKDEFVSPLRGLDNVILTPHIGGSTMEAQANIGLEVAEKLVRYSTTAPPPRRSTFLKWRCHRIRASTASCTSTATCRACCRKSTASWPTTTSTLLRSTCRPTNRWAMW